MVESNKGKLVSVRPTYALTYGIIFSLGVAITLRWLTHRWRLQTRLHSRVVLMVGVKEMIERWEEPCLREVEEMLLLNEKGTTKTERLFNKSSLAPFYGSLRSIAFAPGLDLCQMISFWRAGRHLCADFLEDMLWIERLGYILRYVAFRRLALMEEARYYSATWRYALYNYYDVGTSSGANDHNVSRYPRIPPWLVHQRPFWLVPFSAHGVGMLFSLPLSYFPVESIFTCTAEETWIKEIVDLLPSLKSQVGSSGLISNFVKNYHSVSLARVIIQERHPASWCRLWNEIDRLFIQHGVPLAKGQLAKREEFCRRFYREKMFENIVMVSGVGPDMEMEELGKDVETVSGCYTLRRDPRVSRELRWLLGLRSLSHAVRLGIGLLTPQYNAFAEWMLFSAMSSTCDNTQREEILTQYALYVLRAALATTARAILFSLDDVVKSKICELLRQELTHELCVKLAITDEAFMQRFVERGVHGRENPIESTFIYAESAASQMVMRFDYEVRKYLTRFFVFALSLWRHEIDLAFFACVVARIDYYEIAHRLSCYCGITVERKLNHDIMSLEEKSLPCSPRYGLQLVMGLLVTDQKQYKRSSLSYLSIVVCAGVFVLDWPAPIDVKEPSSLIKKYEFLLSVKLFFDHTIDSARCYLSSTRRMDEKILVKSLVHDALCIRNIVLKDALESCGTEIEKDIQNKKKVHTNLIDGELNFATTFTGKNGMVHPVLDIEENDLLLHHSITQYIPQSLAFEDVFDRHPRFILCQLGLESIFAYKAAMGVRQSNRRSTTETLVDLASSPFNNLFGQIFIRLMEFTEKLLLHALLFRRNTWSFVSFAMSHSHVDTESAGWNIIVQLGRISSYRTLLKDYEDGSFGSPFRLVQQLARYLPTTLHDASPIHYAPCFVERRMAWKLALQDREGLEFDDVGRITGGFFPLLDCIEFSGVNFVYPQLHHTADSGSLSPTLVDINLKFLAGKLTAIIGPTGSGKSTVLRLLNRMYDPVVLLPDVHDDLLDYSNSSDVVVGFVHSYLRSCFPFPHENVPLNSILLDGVPMWCFSTSYIRKAFGFLEQDPCIVRGLSFRQNIALFAPFVSNNMVMLAAKLSQCDVFIESCPLGFDTSVGGLSAGEKQRLALARTLVRFIGLNKVSNNILPGAILLDEPTGRLDGHNEVCVHAAIAELHSKKGLTIITVAHRLSAFHLSTHAVVLQNGQVEYSGHFDSLFSSSVFFRGQAALQKLNCF